MFSTEDFCYNKAILSDFFAEMPEQPKPKNIEGLNTTSVEIQELSDSDLKWGYWVLTHKDQFSKLGNVLLMVFIAITFGYAMFSTAWFFIFQFGEYQQMLATAGTTFVNSSEIRQNNRVQNLEIRSRNILPGIDGRSDIIARIKNPNTKWALKSFDYQFVISGQILEPKSSFLLPGEEKYIFELNFDKPVSGTPQILIDNEIWQRVVQFEETMEARTNFGLENEQFISSREGEASDRLPVSEARVDLVNNSAFNYITLDVQVALFSGTQVVAFNSVPLRDIRSGQSRVILSRWTQNLPPITRTEFIPSVNIVDPEVYEEIEGVADPDRLDFSDDF